MGLIVRIIIHVWNLLLNSERQAIGQGCYTKTNEALSSVGFYNIDFERYVLFKKTLQ
jgi:hypothetical protein